MAEIRGFLVENADALGSCCAHLASQDQVGFDTEFIGESTYHPDLCLIQIATAERLYVIDPLSVGSLEQFWPIVCDPKRVLVVHAGREEVRICQQQCGQTPRGIFDLQIAAGLIGIGYPMGYANLVSELLQQSVPKGETLSDWSRRPLSSRQVEYAFNDVRYLLPLYESIRRQLERLGRRTWMEEESAALIRHALFDGPEFERWRKLRGIGSLDRKRLAIVRELFSWRESVAERQNRPARTVLRDDLLVEIARRNPKSENELAGLRGVPARDHAALAAAVQRGRDTPRDAWPDAVERDIDPPVVALISGFLSAILADLCARWSLTPGLVATTADLRRIVSARYRNRPELIKDSAFGEGWRETQILPVLNSILDGRHSVGVGDLRERAPLRWGDGPAPGIGP
jgi:ribonuclease D